MNRIIFVSNTANFSKFNRPLMRWLRENGWYVAYAANADERVDDCDQQYEIPIARSPFSLSNLKAIKQLKAIIYSGGYNVVHCHTPMGSVVARLAAFSFRKNGLKIIYTCHGFHFYKKAPILNWLLYFPVEKMLSYVTDYLFTINSEDYDFANRYLNMGALIRLNGVGIDFNRFFPVTYDQKHLLRIKYGFDDADFIVIYIAEFIPRKNHEFLLKAIPELKKMIPKLKVLLPGKGQDWDRCREIARNLHIEDDVFFLGYRKDIPELCQISDVHVSTSRQEGQGINNVESMAAGLPVVCSTIRGHVDTVIHNENGFLFELGNRNQMIEYIYKLYVDHSLCEKISARNPLSARKFSVEESVAIVARVYTALHSD